MLARTKRYGLIAAAATVSSLLAGCEPTAPAPAPAPAPSSAQVEAPPASPKREREAQQPTFVMPAMQDLDGKHFVLVDEAIDLSLKLPEPPDGNPVLMDLQANALRFFSDDYDMTHRMRIAMSDEPRALEQFPYKHHHTWVYTATNDELISLYGYFYEWMGQARGERSADTVIARRDGTLIEPDTMFLPGVGEDAPHYPHVFAGAVCEAAKAEKLRKTGRAEIRVKMEYEPIDCSAGSMNVSVGRVALAPSDAAGRFGGIRVYYGPYMLGSNAEGIYTLQIPQSVFVDVLKPEYRRMFGGTPPPLPEADD